MSYSFARATKPDLASKYRHEHIEYLWNEPLLASVLFTGLWSPDQVKYEVLSDAFCLSDQLEPLLDPFMEYLHAQNPTKSMTDGDTVRMNDAELMGDTLLLTLQSATYFKYLLTNWAAGQNYAVRVDPAHLVPLRDIVEPGPSLRRLTEASAANHVGVSCVLECEDQIVMSLRGGRQITDSGMLGLSASGVLANNGARTDPFRHILTELHEELGLDDNDVDYDSVRLIGIAREHQRAGKPEMFFHVRSTQPLGRLKSTVLERKGIDTWETLDYVWVNPLVEDNWDRVRARNILQPSARIGLWMYFKALSDRALLR